MTHKPSRKDIETLKSLLESHCGLCFKEKENILLRQTTERMATVKIASLGEYLFYLFERGDDELHQLVNLLTINETYFYRHADQIALLRETAEAMVRREPYVKFRVWSAGCSIGAEPYTLAIALQDIVRQTGADFKIIATDIDSEVLAKAETGVYSKRQVTAEMPPDLLERHFTRLPNDNFQISDELKRMVSFKKHNLKTEIYPEGMDIIFCRNVLIYFNSRSRNAVIQRMHAALRHGPSQTGGARGLLFLSPVESVPEFRVYFTEILGKDGVKCYQKWTTDRRDMEESPEQSEKRRPLETNPYPSVERTHACGTDAPGQGGKIMISGIIDGSERIEMINKELLLALGEQASLCAADGVDRLGPRRFSLDLTNLVYITNEGLSALWQTLSESRRRGIGIDCVEVAGEGMQQILERAGFRTFGHIGMKKPKSEIPTPNEIRTHACGNPNTRVWKSQLPTSRQACFETQKVTETSPRSVGGLDLGQTRPGVGSSSAHRLVVTESVVEEDMVRRYEDKFFSLLRDIESNQSADKEIIIDLKSCHYVDKSFFVALKRFHTACGTRADVTIECPDYLELWLHKYQIPRARVPHACVPGKRAVTQTRLSTNAGSNSL